MKDTDFINNEAEHKYEGILISHIQMSVWLHLIMYNICINWKNWMANPYYPHPLTAAAWFTQVTDSNVHLQCLSDELLPSCLTHLPQHLQ